jgi:hypothetical protein
MLGTFGETSTLESREAHISPVSISKGIEVQRTRYNRDGVVVSLNIFDIVWRKRFIAYKRRESTGGLVSVGNPWRDDSWQSGPGGLKSIAISKTVEPFVGVLNGIWANENLAHSFTLDGRGLAIVNPIDTDFHWSSGNHGDILVWNVLQNENIRSLVNLKLLLHFLESLSGGSGRGIGGIPLLPTVLHLESRKNGVHDDGSDPGHFRSRFPPWTLLVPAFIGLFIGWYGWHNIRNGRRLFWSVVIFLIGIILWAYEVFHFVKWSEKF